LARWRYGALDREVVYQAEAFLVRFSVAAVSASLRHPKVNEYREYRAFLLTFELRAVR
jgi:hypothetical protein